MLSITILLKCIKRILQVKGNFFIIPSFAANTSHHCHLHYKGMMSFLCLLVLRPIPKWTTDCNIAIYNIFYLHICTSLTVFVIMYSFALDPHSKWPAESETYHRIINGYLWLHVQIVWLNHVQSICCTEYG